MPVNKVRRRGSYAPLSAHYYKDDRLIRAGEKAELLYVRALAFCADVLNDGYITDAQLAHVGVGLSSVKARAKALVDVGAWQRCEGGYAVVAWLSWNKSREAILEDNRKDADRKGEQGSDQPLPPEPPPGDERDSDPWDDVHSKMLPDGVRPEAERSPEGARTGSHARGPARAPSNSNSRAEPEPELFDSAPIGEGAVADATAGDDKPKRGRPRKSTDDPKFDEFWKAWPRKQGKTEAKKRFSEIAGKKIDADKLIATAKAQVDAWSRGGKPVEYIPHASTWLNKGRYEDEIEQPGLRLAASGGVTTDMHGGSISPWANQVAR